MVFTTRDGKLAEGILVRQYVAFEGDTRYIICVDGIEHRCHVENGVLVEM